VAALITDKLKLATEIEPGSRGEFTVWVDGVKVAEKTRTGFPAEPAIVEAVSKAITK
jgi:predicted Rdx family selenoprotein